MLFGESDYTQFKEQLRAAKQPEIYPPAPEKASNFETALESSFQQIAARVINVFHQLKDYFN